MIPKPINVNFEIGEFGAVINNFGPKIEEKSLENTIEIDFWSFLGPQKIVEYTLSNSSRKNSKVIFEYFLT